MTIKTGQKLRAFLGSFLIAGAITGPAMAQTAMPDPKDEAGLYELAKKEGSMVFYHGGPEDPMRKVADRFQEKYPGIAVSTVRNLGVQVYQKFAQETKAGQYIADVVMFSDYPTMVYAIDEGLYASWKVPTFDRFTDAYKLQDKSYAVYLNDVAIAYNVNKVTPEEVDMLAADWRAVADPRFKGRLAFHTSACATCYAPISMFLDPKMEGYGKEFLEKITANKPGVYATSTQALDRIVAGEYAITFSFEGALIPLWQKGAPIRWVHPNPSPLFVAPMFGVSATAPHPAAARLFLNWIASDGGADVMQREMGSILAISDHPDDRPVVKEPWYSPIRERYTPDMDRWTEQYDAEMGLWADVLKKSAQQ